MPPLQKTSMKIILRVVALVIAMASAAAHANTYSFSYSFENGINVTGVFDAIPNGGLVTDISNGTVFVNGVNKGEHLSSDFISQDQSPNNTGRASFDATNTNFGFSIPAATVADDGTPQPFIFSFVTRQYNDSYDVVGLLDFSLGPEHALTTELYTGDVLGGLQSRWHLQEVGAVPEPETYAMLLAGLGLVGFVARRRKQV